MVSNWIGGKTVVASEPEEAAADATKLVCHLNAAYNLARWLVRNTTDAEDLVQESYLRALRSFHTFRGCDCRPWLLAIVRNVCYDWLRRNSKLPIHDMASEDMCAIESNSPSPEAMLFQKRDSEALRNALDRLPVGLREIIILREFEQMSYKDISQISGLPQGTVMSRLSRARRQLERDQAASRHAGLTTKLSAN